jgi:hypothetical protein
MTKIASRYFSLFLLSYPVESTLLLSRFGENLLEIGIVQEEKKTLHFFPLPVHSLFLKEQAYSLSKRKTPTSKY